METPLESRMRESFPDHISLELILEFWITAHKTSDENCNFLQKRLIRPTQLSQGSTVDRYVTVGNNDIGYVYIPRCFLG